MGTRLMDFTRGTQVSETIAMMFASALRPMAFTALAIIAAFVGWLVWTESEPGDAYYWLMHVYASFWTWLEFSPDKLVTLKTQTQGNVLVHIASVKSYPPLQAAWLRLWSAVSGGVVYGLLVGIPLAIISIIALKRFGSRLIRREHERGSQLVKLPQLEAEIAAYNQVEGKEDRAADARRLLGQVAWHKAPFVSREDLVSLGAYEPFVLAGVSYPWRSEQTHTLLVGTTGTGKSTVMKDLLAQIRERGGRAVVFDLTGTYVESFYQPDTDIILNPFDARCPKWSPFSDAHTREHFKEASLALVPIADGGEQFWPESARMLFVEVCVRLVQQGRGNNEALSDVLMTSKLKDLHAHVLKTVAAPLTDPEAKRMAESIRATFNTYAQALMTLPTEGREFSVRDWVQASDGIVDDDGNHKPAPGSVLFIAAQHVNLRSVRVLLTLWLTTAINTLMSMRGDQRDIRLWFLLDEINALHNIPAIVSGMQTARNYGGAFVLGVHTIHQLRETYGDNLAETIASLAKTKLLLATKDKVTQEWESAQVGDGEWAEREENLSYGVSNVRDAATLQRKVKLEPLVLPSQFNELRNLTGYIKFAEGMPAALVKITHVKYEKPNPGFIERVIAPLAPPAPPPLALPHYITVNGVRVTRDGEIVDTAQPVSATVAGPSNTTAAPASDPPSDSSGEGFQIAKSTGGVPERMLFEPVAAAIAKAHDWVEGSVEAGRVNLDLDPRLNPMVKAGDGGNSAVAAADQARRGVEGKVAEAAATELAKDAPREGLAAQEQRQYLGEAEKAAAVHARSQGNNIPAHHLPPPPAAEPDREIDEDHSWGSAR